MNHARRTCGGDGPSDRGGEGNIHRTCSGRVGVPREVPQGLGGVAVGRGHRVVAVDGDVAVMDRRAHPVVQRVISHTVKTAIRTQTVAPT